MIEQHSFRYRISHKRNLGTKFPEMAKQWHPTKNGIMTPYDISSSSGRKVWWVCTKGHEWSASPNSRSRSIDCANHGCPHCAKSISIPCTTWLDSKGIVAREVTIRIQGRRFRVDGFDSTVNTIYEFLGDYWHGNPEIYELTDINPSGHRTFGSLFRKTMDRFEILVKAGYNIVYRWESSDHDEEFLITNETIASYTGEQPNG